MSDSFGARLRQERERRQIALRSIADSTKISLPLLEGLESDNVTRWPSGIFRKAFIRSYAQAIGLEPDSVVREFEERYPDPLQPVCPAEETVAAPIPLAIPPAVGRTWRRLLTPLAELRKSAWLERWRGWKVRGGSMLDERLVVKVTINSAGSAFTRGTLLADIRKRGAAAACDAGVSCLIAVGLFPVVGHFWTPLGVAMLCYYFGGILILGNTPGVCLFAPSDRDDRAGSSKTH